MWPFAAKQPSDPLRPPLVEATAVADALAKVIAGRPANDADPSDSTALDNLIQQGYALDQEIKRLEKELAGVNARLIEAMDDGEKRDAGRVRAQCIARARVRITNPDSLCHLLGDIRYAELVKERVSASPTDRLLELSQNVPELAALIEERVDRYIKYTRLEESQ